MGSMPKPKKKNIPRSINEMSKETLQETLRKKKECNAKALQTVEKLCESSVDEEWFLANLEFINQCHFDDVTVERAITKICGYPLCNQKLEKVPNQQYHISTRYNKVFDITERKNFCSSCCYKSAMHVKKQLFTSPLWFRDQEVIPKYSLLEPTKSSMGEEVVFLPDKIRAETEEPKTVQKVTKVKTETEEFESDNFSSSNEVNQDSIEDLEERYSGLHIQEDDVEMEETMESENLCVEEKEIVETNDVVMEEEPVYSMHDVKSMDNKPNDNTVIMDNKAVDDKPKTETKDEPGSVIEKVEKCVFEWFTLETFFYLYGEQKLKELLQDKATAVKEIISSKLRLAGKNEKINRMIQLYGLLDTDSFSSSEVKTNLKPLPDYSILKEEGKTLEIKVRAFYQGQLEIKKPPKEEEKKNKEEETNVGTSEPNYLPLIDAHAQTALRRKIILDKLNRVLPELMKIFSSDYTLQMSEVRNLVSTFALSAHNITFKPTVWYLVGIILLKLLSIKDKTLRSILESESSKSQVVLVLRNFELESDYLDNLIIRLTDSQSLMEKLNEVNR